MFIKSAQNHTFIMKEHKWYLFYNFIVITGTSITKYSILPLYTKFTPLTTNFHTTYMASWRISEQEQKGNNRTLYQLLWTMTLNAIPWVNSNYQGIQVMFYYPIVQWLSFTCTILSISGWDLEMVFWFKLNLYTIFMLVNILLLS